MMIVTKIAMLLMKILVIMIMRIMRMKMMRMRRTAVLSPIIFCPRPVFGTLPSSMGVSELDHGDGNDGCDENDY